jgi:acetyltransferase-like isoleucine patch superfamily enzyme
MMKNLGKIIGRILRVLAWIAPIYQFRTSIWRRCGVKIGKRVYIGNLAFFDGEYPHLITIDDEASIGPMSIILAHSGGSPYHHQTGIFNQPPQPVHIKRGAWIGSNAIILPGVTIGEGAIVAAGSVVNREVPDLSIVAGNPARVVSKLPEPKKLRIKEKK